MTEKDDTIKIRKATHSYRTAKPSHELLRKTLDRLPDESSISRAHGVRFRIQDSDPVLNQNASATFSKFKSKFNIIFGTVAVLAIVMGVFSLTLSNDDIGPDSLSGISSDSDVFSVKETPVHLVTVDILNKDLDIIDSLISDFDAYIQEELSIKETTEALDRL